MHEPHALHGFVERRGWSQRDTFAGAGNQLKTPFPGVFPTFGEIAGQLSVSTCPVQDSVKRDRHAAKRVCLFVGCRGKPFTHVAKETLEASFDDGLVVGASVRQRVACPTTEVLVQNWEGVVLLRWSRGGTLVFRQSASQLVTLAGPQELNAEIAGQRFARQEPDREAIKDVSEQTRLAVGC